MAYYGNPSSFKQLNKNVFEGRLDAEQNEIIEAIDALVFPILEGHLHSIFTSWPAANNTNQSVISTIWLLMMGEQLQKSQFATNTTGSQSGYGVDIAEQLHMILADMKAGRIVVPGAERHSYGPVGSHGTGPSRPHWVPETVSESETVQEQFPHGLRR